MSSCQLIDFNKCRDWNWNSVKLFDSLWLRIDIADNFGSLEPWSVLCLARLKWWRGVTFGCIILFAALWWCSNLSLFRISVRMHRVVQLLVNIVWPRLTISGTFCVGVNVTRLSVKHFFFRNRANCFRFDFFWFSGGFDYCM